MVLEFVFACEFSITILVRAFVYKSILMLRSPMTIEVSLSAKWFAKGTIWVCADKRVKMFVLDMLRQYLAVLEDCF